MTRSEFVEATGHEPQDDDMERTNCPYAGYPGHVSCGICANHGLPLFLCKICFSDLANAKRQNEVQS